MNPWSTAMRQSWLCLAVLAAVTTSWAGFVIPDQQALSVINADRTLQYFHVAGNVFLLANPAGGTNITVQAGAEGILVVDTGIASDGERIVDMLRRLSPEPFRYLLNTTGLPAYTGSNETVSVAGHGYEGVYTPLVTRASGVAHENAMLAMATREDEPMSDVGYPNLSFFGSHQPIWFNDETVDIFHMPAANTSGESIVVFRRSDVVSAGPVFLTTTYPKIFPQQGGTIDGVIRALNRIIDITNTRKNQEGGTLVIPGEGRVTDESEVVEYRDMLTIIRNRIAWYMQEGKTLAEIQAARPTFDYDARYAANDGPASAAEFVDIIYGNLQSAMEDSQ